MTHEIQSNQKVMCASIKRPPEDWGGYVLQLHGFCKDVLKCLQGSTKCHQYWFELWGKLCKARVYNIQTADNPVAGL